MKDREDTAIRQGRLTEEQLLSDHMQQSWETGDFWIMYAVRNSFAFDEIYWKKIDPRFFGSTTNPERAWEERLILLDEEEKTSMEQLVVQKVEEMTRRSLAWDPDEYTAEVWEQPRRQKGEASEEKNV